MSPSGLRVSLRKERVCVCLCVCRVHKVVLNIKVRAQWQAVNVFFRGTDYWKSPLRFIALATWVRVQVPWLACMGFGLLSVAYRSVWSSNSENLFENQRTLLPLFREKDRYRNQLICSKKSGRFYISCANSAHWERKKRNVRLQAANCLASLSHAWNQEFCGIPQCRFFL